MWTGSRRASTPTATSSGYIGQIRKRLKSGEIYLDDSLQHRRFTDELVSIEEQTTVLKQMDIPWLRRPIDDTLDALSAELRAQWLAFNRELRQGKLKHLDYDEQTKSSHGIAPRLITTPRSKTASTNNYPSAMSPTSSAL